MLIWHGRADTRRLHKMLNDNCAVIICASTTSLPRSRTCWQHNHKHNMEQPISPWVSRIVGALHLMCKVFTALAYINVPIFGIQTRSEEAWGWPECHTQRCLHEHFGEAPTPKTKTKCSCTRVCLQSSAELNKHMNGCHTFVKHLIAK